MRLLNCIAGVFSFISIRPVFAESSIQYHYGNLSIDYENYTGLRNKIDFTIHEFSILDASGELSAGLSNVSSQYSAEQGAIAEEKRKVREGESLGGSKIISYSWQEVAAREGDTKRYGLRLGSTENAFSMETITGGSSSQKYSSLAEFSLIGALSSDVLLTSTYFMLRSDIFWGFRLGLFRDVDIRGRNMLTTRDQKVDSGYFYLPLSYRLSFYMPFMAKLEQTRLPSFVINSAMIIRKFLMTSC